MEDSTDNNTEACTAINPWYVSAVATAMVGGVFSLIASGLLVSNYVKNKIVEPKREEQLEALKTELRSKPGDQQLISQIRQLDLQFRQDKIRSWDFTSKGSFLLLASVTVLLVGTKCAAAFKKRTPLPQLPGDKRNEQLRQARWARWALTGSLVTMGLGAILLMTRPAIDFTIAAAGRPVYPSDEELGKNWPRFRGLGGLGISAYTNVPAKWNGRAGETIMWKTNVPLPGHNSPVVWEDRVFLSGADANHREVYCFDAFSGKLLWTARVTNVPQSPVEPVEVMKDTGFAAPTMVADGRRVYAIFANGDVVCFDFNGRRLWARNLGVPDSPYGYASSLAMFQNLLLIQYDQGDIEDGKSKLIALNAFSGRTVWQMKRPVRSSWTSPVVVKIANQYQLVTCADPWVISYNPANGTELWRAKCLAGDIAPSAIYAGGYIFAIEPYGKLVAIRPDGQGDVTKTHIAWTIEESAPDICSPVSNGKLIFLLTTEGILFCYKVVDGTKLWEKDLRETFMASPSLVGNRLYLLSEKGVMFVAQTGAEYKELARSELGEKCYASPAFMDGRIYIRGVKNLYCIGTED